MSEATTSLLARVLPMPLLDLFANGRTLWDVRNRSRAQKYNATSTYVMLHQTCSNIVLDSWTSGKTIPRDPAVIARAPMSRDITVVHLSCALWCICHIRRLAYWNGS